MKKGTSLYILDTEKRNIHFELYVTPLRVAMIILEVNFFYFY